MLDLRPQNKLNWYGLAVSYHMLKNYDTAEKVLVAFEEGNKEEATGPVAAYEESESHLYRNMLIEESGDYARALEHLNTVRTHVVDKRTWSEARARLFMKSNQLAHAEVEYAKLLDTYPDDVRYLNGLLEAKGLNDKSNTATAERAIKVLKETSSKFPRSHAATLLALDYATGDGFQTALTHFLTTSFRKGVPSLFNNLSH